MLPDRHAPIRVLAVDDEAFNLDLIEFAFAESDDVVVSRAINGRQALDMLAGELPDVVLLDLAMPVLNGFDTLAAMRADARLGNLPVVVVTANAEELHRALELGANDFLAKPFDVRELMLRTRNHARMKAFQDYLGRINEVLEERVAQRTAELSAALDLARRTEHEVAFRLGRAAEYRDLETGAHIRRMSLYTARLAELHGLPPEEVQLIQKAAPLHDIGKVGIPDAILLKPGKLIGDELRVMQGHASIGGAILDECDQFELLAAGRIIATQHHERFDGTGYPAGLAGEAIHIYGRLAAVADVFDALTTRRVYKAAFTLDETLAIMREGRGKHFDPAIVDLLLDNLDDFLAIGAEHADRAEELDTLEVP